MIEPRIVGVEDLAERSFPDLPAKSQVSPPADRRVLGPLQAFAGQLDHRRRRRFVRTDVRRAVVDCRSIELDDVGEEAQPLEALADLTAERQAFELFPIDGITVRDRIRDPVEELVIAFGHVRGRAYTSRLAQA